MAVVYSYSARDKAGNIVKGTYEADDKHIVIKALKTKGLLPINIKQKNSGISTDIFPSRVRVKDIAIFCRQFSTVLEAGIPVLDSIDVIRQQTDSKRMREILSDVYRQVQKGRSLSNSFRKFNKEIPSIMINMIEAGELSGTLDHVMDRLSDYFDKESKIVGKVKGALTYPAIIALVAFIAIIVLLVYVVPQFITMYSGMGAELPFTTKLLIDSSNFLVKHIILILIFVIGGTFGIIYYASSESGRLFFSNLTLKLPFLSKLYRKMLAARFSRTMASLLKAGISLIQCIEITDKVISNATMSKYLRDMKINVSKGAKLSTAIMGVPFFPSMLGSMVSIGEESGALDQLLDKTADFYEDETQVEVDALTSLIEPAVILIMAIVVGGIAVAMVQPMFGVFESLGNL